MPNPDLLVDTMTPVGSNAPAPQAPASPGYAPNPDQFMQNVVPINRTVDVKLNPTTTTDTNKLNAAPVTGNDINSLIQQNLKFQQDVLGLMQPNQQETSAVQQKNDAYNTLQNFDVSLEGGIKNIMAKPIALEFQQGQQAAMTRDAGFTRSSLARSYDASVANLTAIQNQRNQMLQAAQTQVGFGQQNIATQLQMDQLKKQEQAAAIKFALDNQVSKPYFLIGQTVYDTNSGQPFTSEEDFQKKTGIQVGEAQAKGLIQTQIKTPEQRQMEFEQQKFEFQQQAEAFDEAYKMRGLDIEEFRATHDGLTPGQINQTVNGIANQFDSEPIVKNYNTAAEGYNTLKSIGTSSKSPADDIAFIYGFAKIMDPNSVVREGEYNTVQRYAQTWADNFGFKIERLYSNTNFLSADAKQKMLNTIESKYKTLESQYNQTRSEYQRQMDDAYQGKPRSITDYSITPDTDTMTKLEQEWQSTFKDSAPGSLGPSVNLNKGMPGLDFGDTASLGLGGNPNGRPIAYAPAQGASLASSKPKPNAVIAGFDIGSYATDPNHEKAIASIYGKITTSIRSEQQMDAYIQQVAKGSPVKASYITEAAKQYGVDAYLIAALMQQDSTFGTKGKAVRTRNPGNVGNTDSGATQGFATWKDGVLAVARNLSKRRVVPVTTKKVA